METPYRFCPYCECEYRGHACPCGEKPDRSEPDPYELADHYREREKERRLDRD
jgi:hypothetical protein